MKNEWETLGIAPTENKRAIKKAYAAKLAQYHPEDHPQEFKEIQAAYSSIMDSLNRDYTKQTELRSDLKDAFKKKDTFYQDDIQTTKKQQENAHFIDEEIYVQATPKKQKNTSLYDELNLDLSFHKIDQEQAQKKTLRSDVQYDAQPTKKETSKTKHEFDLDNNLHQQKPTKENKQPVSEEEKRRLLSDLYYEKFLERINYQKTLYMLESLILNDTFFKQMEDPYFYKKISRTLISLIPTLNSVIQSFLYDSFAIIMEHYQYSKNEMNVPGAISDYRIKEVARKKRNKLFKVIGTPLLIAIVILVYTTSSTNETKRKQEQQKQTQEIYHNTEIKKTKEKNEAAISLNKAIEETYQLPYKCSVDLMFIGYGHSYLYYCQYEENKYMGSVEYDKDGNITYLEEPRLTSSETPEEVSE